MCVSVFIYTYTHVHIWWAKASQTGTTRRPRIMYVRPHPWQCKPWAGRSVDSSLKSMKEQNFWVQTMLTHKHPRCLGYPATVPSNYCSLQSTAESVGTTLQFQHLPANIICSELHNVRTAPLRLVWSNDLAIFWQNRRIFDTLNKNDSITTFSRDVCPALGSTKITAPQLSRPAVRLYWTLDLQANQQLLNPSTTSWVPEMETFWSLNDMRCLPSLFHSTQVSPLQTPCLQETARWHCEFMNVANFPLPAKDA